MIVSSSLILRLAIAALLFLPLVVPTVSRTRPARYERSVTILSNRNHTALEKQELLADVRRTFGEDASVRIENHASATLHPLQVFDSIGQAVRDATDLTVLDLEPSLWGDTARLFETKLLATDVAGTGRLFSRPPEASILSESKAPFLFVADLYVPKVSFLGEETIAVVEITGRLPAGRSEDIEILVRSNRELVASVRATAVGKQDHSVHEIIEVPVSFLKAQAQTLNVSLRSPLALSPYDRASTTVFVAHNKTTILHVTVGPDWSLRTLRQKLKFWPNLDLLSYYILRERWDENTVPQGQLSLIEFPSEKLFGEQLPNFHGIVAQNFYFDHYLEQRDALNLVEYVRSGGRMFLQAGPLSFLSQDPAIQALFPCEAPPEFVTAPRAQRWQASRDSDISLPEELKRVLPSILTSVHFEGCQPKDDTHVLATRDNGEPVLLARNLGRGLVVANLSADWHTHALSAAGAQKGNQAANMLSYNLQVAATEKLMDWIIEFLQRRQDSGLRAPELSGPRLFSEDRFVLTRSRGAFRQDAQIVIEGSDRRRLLAHPIVLPFLEKQGLTLEEPLAAIMAGTTGGEDDFAPLSLGVRTPGQSSEDEKALMRGGLWPILSRKGKYLPENHTFLASVPELGDFAPRVRNDDTARTQVKDARPILEAYPWLMALALGLLFLDTLIGLLFRRAKTP